METTDQAIDSSTQSLLNQVSGLRRLLGAGEPASLESALTELSDGIENLGCEHSGMVRELLGAYEQLGIVFEVTRNLPDVEHEDHVLELFVHSLSKSFQRCQTRIVHVDSRQNFLQEDGAVVRDERLREFLQSAVDRKTTMVESPGSDDCPNDGPKEYMAGPLFCGNDLVCVLMLTRGAEAREFQASEMLLMDSLLIFCGDLIRTHRLLCELRDLSSAVVRSLVSAVDQKDEYTCGHSIRVGFYSDMLARDIGFNGRELRMLQWSALLHDVGKIGIRDDVLKKPGKLTKEEFDHMKEHPVRSRKVVESIPQLTEAVDGALYHHERFDGSGYPEGLRGEGIPLQARIIQVADIFDALTSNRSYRQAFDWEKALSILRDESGTTVDPRLQERFEELIRQRLEGRSSRAWQELVQEAEGFGLDQEHADEREEEG